MTGTNGLESVVQDITGQGIGRRQTLGGGCIAQVMALTLDDGTELVCKQGTDLDLEGRMLRYLNNYSNLPAPDVLHSAEDMLLMTRLPAGGRLNGPAQADAARHLADLHRITADRFGFDWDTVIGGLPQPNPWTANWIDFFRDQRLLHMGRLAMAEGRLPSDVFGRLESLCGHLDRWITTDAAPALIHGDMWTGNVLCDQGRISGFVDPAIYYADPEIELAFSTLFGTFGEPFFSAYDEILPLRDGFFEVRRDLYNLYPLLVHVRLFGGSYVESVDGIIGRLGF